MASQPLSLDRAVSRNTDYSFEDDDEMFGEEALDESEHVVAGPAAPSGQKIFESLAQLRKEQELRIDEAIDCTGLDWDDAFLLLRQYGWDVAAFEEAFFENCESVRKEAGVSESDDAETAAPAPSLCGICFTDPGVLVLQCERRPLRLRGKAGDYKEEVHGSYCQDCWQQYLGHAVRSGRGCLDLRCPRVGCSEAVRPSTVRSMLTSDEALLDRFRRFQIESFVDDSRGYAGWCPGRGCGRAALQPMSGCTEVNCPCGTMWCFGCRTDAHLPVTCDLVQKWEAKNRDEGEDADWIRVNTKLCPKCSNPIEKNGGCMHMTCRKPGGCGHEFCWICMADWNGHKACNAQNEKADAEKNATRSELLRYSHCYERYVAHHKAQLFAAKEQRQGMEALEESLCALNDSLKVSDVKFLTAAVLEISRCRRFLKWTYAYAFYSNFQNDRRKLFEFHQAQLEGTLERLSDIMENTRWDQFLDDEAESFRPFYDLRSQLIDLTSVVHKFFAHLSDAIQQGTLFRAV